jgi:ketosteroid isomerase-like protein
MLNMMSPDLRDLNGAADLRENQTAAEIRAWLEAFAAAVRAVDYAAGEWLFAPDVVGFGTVGVLLCGRETLVESQWRRVWGATSGFRFDMRQLSFGGDGKTAWVAVPWSSRTGRGGDGPHDRTGRATYVLQRRNGRWLAVHSHHSLDPSGMPPGATGR